MNQPLYDLDDLSFSAEGRVILQPLTLQLSQSKIYGLVGPNGSGKSTLIKMLARQQSSTSGSAKFFGQEISVWRDRDYARSVAYMPQFTPPAEGMTVRELVALGRFPWHGALGRFSADDRAKVAEALRDTDLEQFRDRLVDTLSGGERQRVWLAMMIAQDTRCLLLDEPTSALDIAHQVDMLELVRRLSRARSISAVIVLHDVNMAARFCDEILAIREGRLIARGAPDEIMSGEILAGIYGIPMGILPHPVTGGPISYVQ